MGYCSSGNFVLGEQERRRMLGLRKQRGLGMVEMLIGVAIVSVLASVAVPAFGDWIQNSQTRTAAESIQNGLQAARSAAVRRNADVRFALNDGDELALTVNITQPAATGIQAARQ
jgi:prepilin-type N-terminal cleavage/methylation domain-containing protein